MNDSYKYFRLPAGLSGRELAVTAPPLEDDEFAAHQIEFIRRVFGHCAYLREQGRETAVGDAFLSVFVNLIEAMDANAPEEAQRCAIQLLGILRIVFPGVDHTVSSVEWR
ncbi:hypothetical protein F4827_006917 [Paraburkholderia bannensis]|uniref:Uncharacterized protein n=1 Tax=Paraburkholderia bannensis TaxID=765414 RepID=A0A7W9WWW9_9BURK|nr:MULTISPECIES: hypothetical protein [Paraburkholderia]MBB3262041.1 hypothetical protein [Paraburkholderia sp. WP4_3_2]MBB6107037.1 hypothetical protein [Paraburkholderia bannensis]